MTVGEKIHVIREQYNLDHKRLGKMVGISYQVLGRIEKGSIIDTESYAKIICKELNIPESIMLNNDITPQEFKSFLNNKGDNNMSNELKYVDVITVPEGEKTGIVEFEEIQDTDSFDFSEDFELEGDTETDEFDLDDDCEYVEIEDDNRKENESNAVESVYRENNNEFSYKFEKLDIPVKGESEPNENKNEIDIEKLVLENPAYVMDILRQNNLYCNHIVDNEVSLSINSNFDIVCSYCNTVINENQILGMLLNSTNELNKSIHEDLQFIAAKAELIIKMFNKINDSETYIKNYNNPSVIGNLEEIQYVLQDYNNNVPVKKDDTDSKYRNF